MTFQAAHRAAGPFYQVNQDEAAAPLTRFVSCT